MEGRVKKVLERDRRADIDRTLKNRRNFGYLSRMNPITKEPTTPLKMKTAPKIPLWIDV